MPVTSRGEVFIGVVIDESGAVRSINGLDSRLDGLGEGAQRASETGSLGFLKLTGSIFTADLAVQAITNGLRFLRQVVTETFTAGFEAVRNFETANLSLQATLASQLRLSDDATENFARLGPVSEAITERLIELDAQSATTLENLRFGFQAFVASGGLETVRTLDEALEATNLLVNSSEILSASANKQLAIQVAIRSVIQGQSFAQSEVAQNLAGSGEELREISESFREQRNLLDFLRDRLAGIDQASEQFSNTWEGVLSTSETLRDLFLREVFTEVFDTLKTGAAELVVLIKDNEEAILSYVRLGAQGLQLLGAAMVEVGRIGVGVFQSQVGEVALGFVSDKLTDILKLLRVLNLALEDPTLLVSPLRLGEAFAFADIQIDLLRANIERTAAASADSIEDAARRLLSLDLSGILRSGGSPEPDPAVQARIKDLQQFLATARAAVEPTVELELRIAQLDEAGFSLAEKLLILDSRLGQAAETSARLGEPLSETVAELVALREEITRAEGLEKFITDSVAAVNPQERLREKIQQLDEAGFSLTEQIFLLRAQITGVAADAAFLGQSLEPEIDRLNRLIERQRLLSELPTVAAPAFETPELGALNIPVPNPEQFDPLKDALTDLGQLGAETFLRFEGAAVSAFQAAILGSESLGVALKRALAQSLASLGAEGIVRAIWHTAMGIAALTPWGANAYGPAAAQFKAAALFAAVGGAAAAGGRALSGGGGAESQGRGPGLSERFTEDARNVLTLGNRQFEFFQGDQGSVFGFSGRRTSQAGQLIATSLLGVEQQLSRLEFAPPEQVVQTGVRRGGGLAGLAARGDFESFGQQTFSDPRI